MSLRVVHVITNLGQGGAEGMLYKILAESAEHRQQACVVSLGASTEHYVRPIRELGVPIACLAMSRNPLKALISIVQLCRTVMKFQPDIIQSWLYHADLLATATLPFNRKARLFWNIRCSDMDFSHYRFTTRATVKLSAILSALPCGVVVNSRAGLEHHRALGYRPRRWVYIPNGFDCERFSPDPADGISMREELGVPLDAFLVGLVARLDPKKGFETFFEAAGRFIEDRPNVHFILAGRGVSCDNGFLIDLIAKHQLEGRVRLLGPRQDVYRILRALDVLTVASYFGEGFPNILGEAMATGCLVVATDTGDSKEIVGPFGWIVAPRSASQLEQAWHAAASLDTGARRAIQSAGRDRVCGAYSIAEVSRRYLELYGGLTSMHGSPGRWPR